MKTKNILKALVLAAVLVSACSKNDIADDFKGYTLPVTINVTRQGDEPATRATYNESTKKLSFSTGDKLFVAGSDSKAGDFAGLLAWQSEGTFSGTIMTENEYDGTAEELLSSATDDAEALLIPAGYKSYEYFDLDDEITPNAGYYQDKTNAFALTKAAAVEQFSFELAETYSSGFTLSPQNAIVSFTISGLTANKEVAVSFNPIEYVEISKSVTTSAEGVATFAIGLDAGTQLGGTLTVDGNNIAMPTKTTEAGHIYNISRSAAPATDLSTLADDYEAQDGEVLTGTLASKVKISIADGATVTLKNVNITNLDYSCDWPGINCLGDATLVLEETNEVCAGIDDTGEFSNYPAIYIAPGNTLTIQGDGYLTAYSYAYEAYGAGIGGGYDIPCGHIVINSGNIKAQGGYYAAGIGSGGYGSYCGDITINGGNIMATGGDCAAGIGSGRESGYCGTITIKSTVASVTATKGDGASNSIGAGQDSPAITVDIEAGANVTQN